MKYVKISVFIWFVYLLPASIITCAIISFQNNLNITFPIYYANILIFFSIFVGIKKYCKLMYGLKIILPKINILIISFLYITFYYFLDFIKNTYPLTSTTNRKIYFFSIFFMFLAIFYSPHYILIKRTNIFNSLKESYKFISRNIKKTAMIFLPLFCFYFIGLIVRDNFMPIKYHANINAILYSLNSILYIIFSTGIFIKSEEYKSK
jgi:hypothetical protein